jgi:putative ABC transport system substrate-binding protein
VNQAAAVEDAVKRTIAERPQALVILTAPIIFGFLPRIAELARRSRLPSMSPFSTYPEAGGLMTYGPSFPALWRQTASYVDRILKGAKVGHLPVERPSKFELVINLNTAKTFSGSCQASFF